MTEILFDRDNGVRVDKEAVMDKKVLFETLFIGAELRKGGRAGA
jgi:hypothetical protein